MKNHSKSLSSFQKKVPIISREMIRTFESRSNLFILLLKVTNGACSQLQGKPNLDGEGEVRIRKHCYCITSKQFGNKIYVHIEIIMENHFFFSSNLLFKLPGELELGELFLFTTLVCEEPFCQISNRLQKYSRSKKRWFFKIQLSRWKSPSIPLTYTKISCQSPLPKILPKGEYRSTIFRNVQTNMRTEISLVHVNFNKNVIKNSLDNKNKTQRIFLKTKKNLLLLVSNKAELVYCLTSTVVY